MSEVQTLSLKLPEKLNERMLKQIISDGYGMRGKSKWIKEAILDLLALDYYPELVILTDEMEGFDTTLSVRIDDTVMDRIQAALIAIRNEHPMAEGVKSKLVRASILQRLIRKSSSMDLFGKDFSSTDA